jgi:hypothetical protein
MNSNLFHNIANGAMVLLAMTQAGLMATGCVTTATGGLDCAASYVPPQYAAIAIGAIAALKIGVNIARDGVAGLTKPQPPVEQTKK